MTRKINGIVSFVSQDTVYIQCDREGVVSGFPTQVDALRSFEGLYHDAHRRGYERRMSACVHLMHFEVRAHHVEDIQNLVDDVITIPFRVRVLRSIAGTMVGIKCEGPKAREWHDSGVQPRFVEEAV